MAPARSALAALSAALASIFVGCSTTSSPTLTTPRAEYFAPPGGSSLPFSEAVRASDFLFVSGEIGTAPGTLTLVPGGIEPEAAQALENIKAKLERHGATMNDVVKCTVFLLDMKEWATFNGVYRRYFTSHLPARSALGANGLALGARVEIECIAYVPKGAR